MVTGMSVLGVTFEGGVMLAADTLGMCTWLLRCSCLFALVVCSLKLSSEKYHQ